MNEIDVDTVSWSVTMRKHVQSATIETGLLVTVFTFVFQISTLRSVGDANGY